jgi:mannose-1-phosphate guanylyltransferase
MKKMETFVVIMAGGGGTRFWPWSRETRPKQLLPILSERSMIRETFDRLRPFASPGKILVVTSRSQAAQIRRNVPAIPRQNIIVEPSGKNTAPCLCLAALAIRKVSPEAVMVVLPADHAISNGSEFLRTLQTAAEYAAQEDFLVTLGVRPAGPETGYGYIQKGERLRRVRGTGVFRARAFREKPTLAKAKAYLRRGDYLWNSGMFVWRAGVFQEAVKKYLPRLYEDMQGLEKMWGTPRQKRSLEEVYRRCHSVSVDYGIMEKAQNVAVVEARFPWDDVGSWSAMWSIRAKDREGNALIGKEQDGAGRILAIDSLGCLIRGEKNLIAVLGMKNTIVVEAGGAVLVCPRERSQEVRRVIEELRKKGWNEYL